jgi:hypothetical protein
MTRISTLKSKPPYERDGEVWRMIRESLGHSLSGMAYFAGLKEDDIEEIEAGRRLMPDSAAMSILTSLGRAGLGRQRKPRKCTVPYCTYGPHFRIYGAWWCVGHVPMTERRDDD